METVQTLVLELLNRRNSHFVMKGTEGSDNPDYLDTSSEYLVLPTSIHIVDNKRRPIRYIYGCDTIYVDEQKAQGYEPNHQMDIIAFSFGRLTVERDGPTIGLYDYLKVYEGNFSFDGRPSKAVPIYKEVRVEAAAEKELVDLGEFAAAMGVLSGLQTKTKEGFEFDSAQVSYLTQLFGLSNTIPDSMKMQALIRFAGERPVYFMQAIGEATTDLRVQIAQAKEMGVLGTEGEFATWLENMQTFYKFKTKKAESRLEELIRYFNGSAGEIDLSLLQTKLAFAKDKVATVL